METTNNSFGGERGGSELVEGSLNDQSMPDNFCCTKSKMKRKKERKKERKK